MCSYAKVLWSYQSADPYLGQDPNPIMELRQWLDVPYATKSAAQTLDLFVPPDGDRPFPLIVGIHGGAFRMGTSRNREMDPIIGATGRGYAVASLNYRLSSEAIFPAPVADCREAIRFLRSNAMRWNLDPERFVVWGPSAGGYLASMIGAASHVTEFDGDHAPVAGVATTVRAVIDWYGPIDFGRMDAQFDASTVSPRLGPKRDADSPESELLGAPIGDLPDAVRQANPSTHLTGLHPSTAPRFLIQHGTDDQLIPVQQSVGFASAIAATLGPDHVMIDILPGAGHGGAGFEAPSNLNRIFAFIADALQ